MKRLKGKNKVISPSFSAGFAVQSTSRCGLLGQKGIIPALCSVKLFLEREELDIAHQCVRPDENKKSPTS
jgi:hypothetical protein